MGPFLFKKKKFGPFSPSSSFKIFDLSPPCFTNKSPPFIYLTPKKSQYIVLNPSLSCNGLRIALKPSSIFFFFFLWSYQQADKETSCFSYSHLLFFFFSLFLFSIVYLMNLVFIFFFLQFFCGISIENRNLSSIYRPQLIYRRYIGNITNTIPKFRATDYRLHVSFQCRPIFDISVDISDFLIHDCEEGSQLLLMRVVLLSKPPF